MEIIQAVQDFVGKDEEEKEKKINDETDFVKWEEMIK